MTTVPTRIPKRLKEAMNKDMDFFEKELGLSIDKSSYGNSLAGYLERGEFRKSVMDKVIGNGKKSTIKEVFGR